MYAINQNCLAYFVWVLSTQCLFLCYYVKIQHKYFVTDLNNCWCLKDTFDGQCTMEEGQSQKLTMTIFFTMTWQWYTCLGSPLTHILSWQNNLYWSISLIYLKIVLSVDYIILIVFYKWIINFEFFYFKCFLSIGWCTLCSEYQLVHGMVN